jgi:hypothetical protein
VGQSGVEAKSFCTRNIETVIIMVVSSPNELAHVPRIVLNVSLLTTSLG